MKLAKFRPVLTVQQIEHIISLCKKELSQASLSVISKLAPFKAKIENQGVAPAYFMENKPSLIESLGFDADPEYMYLTPIEKRQKAYDKWILDPNSCDPNELELVIFYKWENDLMTPEERKRFEDDLNNSLNY